MATKTEPAVTESWLEKHRYWLVGLALLILCVAYALVRGSSSDPHATAQLALFGDALGPLASLFSLFALLAALEAVALQRREFSKMVEEAKQSSRAQEASAVASRAQVAQEEHREVKSFLEACANHGDDLIGQANHLVRDVFGPFQLDHLPALPMFCGNKRLLGHMVRIKNDLLEIQTAFMCFDQKRSADTSNEIDPIKQASADLNVTVKSFYDNLHDHLEDCRDEARTYFQDLLRNQGLDEIVALKKQAEPT